jgi:hypothetical protein
MTLRPMASAAPRGRAAVRILGCRVGDAPRAQCIDVLRLTAPPPRVRSQCRFRYRGTKYVCESGRVWTSG